VRRSPGKWYDLTASSRHPLQRPAESSDVERELAVENVVDLAGIMAVHYGRTAARLHANVAGKQGAAGFGRGRQHSELISPSVSPSTVAESTGNLSISGG
jgi:hypothetical protein